MNISDYVGKTIIAWHYYNENYEDFSGKNESSSNKRSYIYPRILKKGTEFFEISNCEDEFPQKGRIEIKLTGDLTAEDLYHEVGDIVEIRMNKQPEYNENSNNCYSLRLNPNFNGERAELVVEKFSGKGFTQIINVLQYWESIYREHKIFFENKIYTNEIMLCCNDKFYGPFEYDIKEDYVFLNGKKEYNYFISEYDKNEFLDDIYEVDNPDSNECIQLIIKKAIKSPIDKSNKIDWIDDKKLCEFFISKLKKQKSSTKDEIRRFRDTINTLIEEEQELQLDSGRKERINKILDLTDDKDDLIQLIVRAALANDNFNKEIAQIICEEHFEYVEKNVSEFKKYQEKLEELKNNEKNIKLEIEKANIDLNNYKEQLYLNKKNEILDLENKKASLENEIKNFLSIQDEIKNIEELEIKKSDLNKEVNKLNVEKEIREKDLQKIREKQKDLDEKQYDLDMNLKQIINKFNDETKIIVDKLDKDFLNKISREITGVSYSKLKKFNKNLFYDKNLSGHEIIDIVKDYLNNKANRNVSYNEVVNYITCISQGFITTFVGQPGTGKTSICSLISKALGLAGVNENKRFIEVSVERGWTSHKDFIGYYNPLTNYLEKSNAEVFDAFEIINLEIEEEKKAPMFILLDEANLSPIEHYWSTFIKNCDFDSTTERSINLGGNLKWRIPDNLRFLATVNFDHTTEELSPRFLDRSWILLLEPNQIDEDSFVFDFVSNEERVVSFNNLISEFGYTDEIDIDDNILIKFKNIQNIFKENNMMIMPRNIKMILNYCSVAGKYMQRDTPETRYAPLDFAIAQKILPTISGTGENLNKLIEKLKEECGDSNMPICSKILERMQKKAEENMGYFQFFAM